MNEGDGFENRLCEECGDKIIKGEARKGGKIICEKCFHPMPPSLGNGYPPRNDLSAYGSWDNAVRITEEALQ